jgi:hypothetical protein
MPNQDISIPQFRSSFYLLGPELNGTLPGKRRTGLHVRKVDCRDAVHKERNVFSLQRPSWFHTVQVIDSP